MAREKSIERREQGREVEPWDSFSEMERMMRGFFANPFSMMRMPGRWFSDTPTDFNPQVNLRESEGEFILSAALPGMHQDDIDINVTDDQITISGERKWEEERPNERYHVRQQSYGKFGISYSLSAQVKPDDVKATYKNGLLEVVMPKAEIAKAHKVKVHAEE